MENKRGFIMRNGTCIGMDVQRVYTSTPIGIIQAFSGTTIPRGFLLCDGQSYAVAEYPDLYAVIGNTYGGDSTNFNVPDYRETVLVGVGENTTDTIASHDVYELGEFKDDQLQGHWHNLGNSNGTVTVALGASIKGGSTAGASAEQSMLRYTVENALDAITDGTNGEPRTGTTTHGKQKGVTYIIKAFHTNEGTDSGVSDDVVDYVEGEIAEVESEVDKITYSTDANECIPALMKTARYNLINTSANVPNSNYSWVLTAEHIKLSTGQYYRIIQDINGTKSDGGTIKYTRTATSTDDVTWTWTDWVVDGLISDTTTNTTSTWSSSKIASVISPKADKQNAVRNTDYLKSDRPYLKIARNGSLSHVGYYTCETYMLCNHLGNMGALSFIRTDNGASCVYKDIVGTLSLSVEKYDEYICWLKYSSTSSEIITVYALNGYTPTVSAVTSTA